jgi:hypothetical protein
MTHEDSPGFQSKGKPAVGNGYQATTGEDIAD